MSIIYNNTEIKKLVYNNTEIKEAYYNGIKIYSSTDPEIDYYASMDIISESNWILFIQNDMCRKIVEANRQNEFLTKKVIISNNQTPSYSTWEIADFNHDNSSNTVDLVQVNNVANMDFGGTRYWDNSTIRTWLNGTYVGGFSSAIQNIMKTMTVVTNNNITTYDKVKLLSGTEIGFSNTYIFSGEGTKYPITIGFRSGANANCYWLRSRYTNNSYYGWYVYHSGITYNNYYYKYGVLPVIRF